MRFTITKEQFEKLKKDVQSGCPCCTRVEFETPEGDYLVFDTTDVEVGGD